MFWRFPGPEPALLRNKGRGTGTRRAAANWTVRLSDASLRGSFSHSTRQPNTLLLHYLSLSGNWIAQRKSGHWYRAHPRRHKYVEPVVRRHTSIALVIDNRPCRGVSKLNAKRTDREILKIYIARGCVAGLPPARANACRVPAPRTEKGTKISYSQNPQPGTTVNRNESSSPESKIKTSAVVLMKVWHY